MKQSDLELSDEDRLKIARKHWTKWCPPKKFYQEPLYPYLLGLLYYTVGDDKLVIFAFQSLLGVAALSLLYWSTLRFYGNLVALAAATMATTSAPVVLLEAILLRDTVIVFATSCLITTIVQSAICDRWWPTGILIGLACLLKSHFVLVLGPVIAISLRGRATFRGRFGAMFGIILGFLITGFPTAVRNWLVDAPLIAAPTGGFFTFIGANVPDYPCAGFYQSTVYSPSLIDRSEGSLAKAIVLTIESHGSVSAYILSLGKRVLSSLNWFEVPNNTSSYYYQLHASILEWLPFSFMLVAVLFSVGFVQTIKSPAFSMPFLILILSNWTVLVVFFNIDRYRAPLLFAMMPIGAIGMLSQLDNLMMKRWKPLVYGGLAMLATFVIVLWPLPVRTYRVRATDAMWAFQTSFSQQFSEYINEGNIRKAAEELDRFLTIMPKEVRRTLDGKLPGEDTDMELLAMYSDFFLTAFNLHRESGNQDSAARYLKWQTRIEDVLARSGQ